MKELIEEIFIDAWAINDIISCYQDKKADYPDLFQIVSGYDLSKPTNKIPFKVYVELCSWIEKKLGQFNLIKIGRRIGESTYSLMLETNMVNNESKPLDVMKALVLLAQIGVKDPKRRGWEIVSHTDKSIQMRKTQLFNTHIQVGLLDTLVRKCKVYGVQVNLVKEESKGAEFDEYLITWL